MKNVTGNRMRLIKMLLPLLAVALFLAACGQTPVSAPAESAVSDENNAEPITEEATEPPVTESAVERPVTEGAVEVAGDDRGTDQITTSGTRFTTPEAPQPVAVSGSGCVVAIDPGHQQKGNYEKEPDGPGSSTKKYKVSGGAVGASTGTPEYEITLQIALKLQKQLEQRGYMVVMTRTTNDVDISNSERAAIANDAGADAFIRIHADSSEVASANGATALCQSRANPYNGDLYLQSRKLAEDVVGSLSTATGCRNRGVTETDTMSGINWCRVPCAIIEVGFLSNVAEEQLLVSDSYQQSVAAGIADGVERFLTDVDADGQRFLRVR